MRREFVWNSSFPHAWAELTRMYDLREVIVILTENEPLLVRCLEAESIVGLFHAIEDTGPSWAKKIVADSSARQATTRALVRGTALLSAENPGTTMPLGGAVAALQDVVCLSCQRKGHYSRNCPHPPNARPSSICTAWWGGESGECTQVR